MDNIDNILALEVKQEIAQRYFGFRKTIENDTHAYMDRVRELSVELEERLGHDLACICTLLDRRQLIDRFIELTGIPEQLLADSRINARSQKNELFSELCVRGFTRKGCFQNMFFDAYARLCHHVDEYRNVFNELAEEREIICEQIRLFYRKNDINSILHFLRGLEGQPATDGSLHYNLKSQEEFEEKMRITPPPPVSEMLPEVPRLPDSRSAKKKLKELAREACRKQPDLDPRNLK